MDIFNDTPFCFANIAGRIPFPGHSLTLIVKATFDLVPDGAVVPSQEQQMTTGDAFYEDDEEMQGSLRYASDFAYFKPLADLTLVGHCHAPKGHRASARRVGFAVGDVGSTLTVYGDRHWIGPVASDPEPFSKMPLRYEYSYGGKEFSKNPSGRGYDKQKDANGAAKRYLPNIMRPGEQLLTPISRLQPAGFGPIHMQWEPRSAKLGSYTGKYLTSRWPWFAEDMDWRHFNAAPDGLQTAYLRGDEDLYFENLHPTHQAYRSKLPGRQVRCFVNRITPEKKDVAQFAEVTMNLDTLWVDMDDAKVVLVWRGWTQVLSEEFEEIQHILVASESLTQKPESVDHYKDRLHQRIKDEEELWEEAPPVEEPEAEADDDFDKQMALAEDRYRKAMVDAGMDPDHPPEPSQEDKRKEAQILEQLGIDQLDTPAPEMTRATVAAQFEATRNISGLLLEGFDLSGMDFSGGSLQETVFSNADLSGARFDGADLTGAVFANAKLPGCSFESAELKNADFSSADCSQTNLRRAKMKDAIFDNARLAGARMEDVDAGGASFIEADLTGAHLTRSRLTGADFSDSKLVKADLTGANLAEATLEGAHGPGVVMNGADLTELRASEKCVFSGGSFKQVSAKESIWESADLRGADFSYSTMEGASFAKANLTGARLRAASMKFARFDKAILREADLVLANGFENNFVNADLTRCDCRQANLYGSEFLNAMVGGAQFDDANLKMTKLA